MAEQTPTQRQGRRQEGRRHPQAQRRDQRAKSTRSAAKAHRARPRSASTRGTAPQHRAAPPSGPRPPPQRTVETGAEAGVFTRRGRRRQQAERAVLIPVGAALVARDNVVEAVKPYTSATPPSASSPSSSVRCAPTSRSSSVVATPPATASVREVKRTRTRVERELRQRRNQATRLVKRNRREAERQVKSVRRDVERQVGEVAEERRQARQARAGAGRRPWPSATLPPGRPERPAPG